MATSAKYHLTMLFVDLISICPALSGRARSCLALFTCDIVSHLQPYLTHFQSYKFLGYRHTWPSSSANPDSSSLGISISKQVWRWHLLAQAWHRCLKQSCWWCDYVFQVALLWPCANKDVYVHKKGKTAETPIVLPNQVIAVISMTLAISTLIQKLK